MAMTQTERILVRLNTGPMCSMEALRWEPPITRVAARILDLRDAGHEIESRQSCGLHREPAHHACYRLLNGDQGELF